jgi:II/X family phage/plasmid replication protein
VVFDTGVWMPVEGSYSSKVHTRIVSSAGSIYHKGILPSRMLWVSGNPVKFLQGHNLFGSDDVAGLARDFMLAVDEKLGGVMDSAALFLVRRGSIRLSRVDCTAMLNYGTPEKVQAVLWQLKNQGSMTFRGESEPSRSTVYFGKHSRRSTLKFYGKGEELKGSKDHRLPDRLAEQDRCLLTEYAAPALRAELTLRAPELEKRGLAVAGDWKRGMVFEQLKAALGEVQVPAQVELQGYGIDMLPPWLRGSYELWRHGGDVRLAVSTKTFYRHRLALLGYGIDIRKPPIGIEEFHQASNVVPFLQTLEGRVMGIPEWAVGTALYYEPAEGVG